MSTVGTHWYTLAEAAPVLGVSVDTVRRRLKKGELEGRQVHTQHGPTWEVCLGSVKHDHQKGAEDAANPAQGVAGGGAAAGVVQLVALVDRLQRENRDLAGQVGFLTAQLAVAESRIAALEAPKSPPDESTEPQLVEQAPAPAEPFPAPLEPSRNVTPWWRRWRSWLAAGLLVAAVGSASCQTSASVKHVGLCTTARASMDYWATSFAGKPLPLEFWTPMQNAVDVAAKVC